MNRTCVMILAFLIFLAGCVPTKTIEDLGIINNYGVDQLENGQLKSTMVIYKFAKQNEETSQIVSGEANTMKRARQIANQYTSFELAPGSIQLALFGAELAKQGLSRYLDPLERDAKISDMMYLAIAEPTAEKIILTGNKNPRINLNRYLNDLIKQNKKNNVIPDVRLIDFSNEYFKIGRDPYLPILSIKDNQPIISSVALFLDDQLVGKIPLDKVYLISMLHKPIKKLNIQAAIPLKPFKEHMKKQSTKQQSRKYAYADLSLRKGKAKTKLLDSQNLKFQTNVKLSVDLMELSEEIDLRDPKVIKKFEKEIENEVKSQYEKLLAYTQKLGADPFGYGVVYRTHQKGNKPGNDKLHEIYPNIDVDFNVDVRILHHGIIP
ncbi:Ger(x)C family spore germination protein [Lentibacillus sp. L22]|uniref:Ger(x)C family spore germination protein n=1 Tax=Lentibacillus sp. L22 TaxID=3163028 RepID=UPI003466ED8B